MMLLHLSPDDCPAIPHWHVATISEDSRSTDACWIANGDVVKVIFWSEGRAYPFEVPLSEFKKDEYARTDEK